MNRSFAYAFAMSLAAVGLAGCNAGSLLQTGSVKPTATAATAQPQPATPIDRALHVASTSARAHKCGFYFDAPALRQSFLAAEAARGTDGALLTKAGQSYDYTALKVAASIKETEAYCSNDRTASIKNSLQKMLAGNFEPPVKKPVAASGGLASILESDVARPEKFDPETIYDPAMSGRRRY